MQDQRKYIRFNAEGSVILKSEEGKSRSIKADLVDISLMGIGVYAQEKMDIGINVKLELITELWEEPIVGEGKIKYAKPIKRKNDEAFRMGIEFIKIEKGAVQYIINHIQEDICAKARKIQIS
jgi:c-di-GMP-binding flagellar brake protein YcgR